MVLNPASRARTQYFLNLPSTSIVVKQSVMKQVIAKYLRLDLHESIEKRFLPNSSCLSHGVRKIPFSS